MNLHARAELRAALKRLMAAANSVSIEGKVQVERRDLDLFLTLIHANLLDRAPVARPHLHPAQR